VAFTVDAKARTGLVSPPSGKGASSFEKSVFGLIGNFDNV
jgi:hypothetical protein